MIKDAPVHAIQLSPTVLEITNELNDWFTERCAGPFGMRDGFAALTFLLVDRATQAIRAQYEERGEPLPKDFQVEVAALRLSDLLLLMVRQGAGQDLGRVI